MSGFHERTLSDSLTDRGYWAPATALGNFCEQDYQIVFYIAEFINTVSNLAYLYYALYPIELSLPGGVQHPISKGSAATAQKRTWDIHTSTLVSIGVCSALFHLSLRRIPQFLDDTSMSLLVAGFAFELLTVGYSDDRVQQQAIIQHRRTSTAIAIVAVVLINSTVILQTGNMLIHEVTFASGLIICGIRMASLMRQHETTIKKRLSWHLFIAAMTLVFGFGLWLVDSNPSYCASLRQFRRRLIEALPPGIGLVLGFVTELHGWWHVLTARAAGEFISLIRFVTSNAPKKRWTTVDR